MQLNCLQFVDISEQHREAFKLKKKDNGNNNSV